MDGLIDYFTYLSQFIHNRELLIILINTRPLTKTILKSFFLELYMNKTQ